MLSLGLLAVADLSRHTALVRDSREKIVPYQSKQEVEIFDEIDQQLPMPEFAQDLQLTIGELFGWFIEWESRTISDHFVSVTRQLNFKLIQKFHSITRAIANNFAPIAGTPATLLINPTKIPCNTIPTKQSTLNFKNRLTIDRRPGC